MKYSKLLMLGFFAFSIAGCENIQVKDGQYLGGFLTVQGFDRKQNYQADSVVEKHNENTGINQLDFNSFIFYYQKYAKIPLKVEDVAKGIDTNYKAAKNEFERRSALDDFKDKYDGYMAKIEKGDEVEFEHDVYLGEYDFKNKGFMVLNSKFSNRSEILSRNVISLPANVNTLFIPFEQKEAEDFVIHNPSKKVRLIAKAKVIRAYSQRTEENAVPKGDSMFYYKMGGGTVTYLDKIIDLKVTDVNIGY